MATTKQERDNGGALQYFGGNFAHSLGNNRWACIGHLKYGNWRDRIDCLDCFRLADGTMRCIMLYLKVSRYEYDRKID